MVNQNDKKYLEEDEIDLRELFKTLWDKKVFILVFTALVTFCAVAYVFFKNPIPVYQGSVMVEIGEVRNSGGSKLYFDDAYTLKNIMELDKDLSITIPIAANKLNNSNNIVILEVHNIDKDQIKKKLNESINFILNRHKEKTELYDKYIMTKQIGEITVGNNPINASKKKLIIIVSLVTGFLVSSFLVFVIQFISSFKKEEK